MNNSYMIYHCCIQKTASQWIKNILKDKLIYKISNMPVIEPKKNFIGTKIEDEDLQFAPNQIITPLYINYSNFIKKNKANNYRAFFVMRDIRDFIISIYFSMKYSHATNPYVKKIRKDLKGSTEAEGISYFIKKFDQEFKSITEALISWYKNQEENKNVKVFRYEDLIGKNNLDYFCRLFKFIQIDIDLDGIKHLLDKYSFKTFAKGREQGEADFKSHYRKGIAGDWKNYFNDTHKELFRSITKDLLIELDYEANDLW